MRKLIIKTALISFAAAVAAVGLFAGACLLFFPSYTSDLAFNIGMNEAAVKYAVKAYERDGEFGSLKTVVERAIIAGDSAVIVRYTPLFMESDEYSELAGGHYESSDIGEMGSYGYYVAGNYVVALYLEGDAEEAVKKALSLTERYTKFNPVERLMTAAVSLSDKELVGDIKAEIGKLSLEGEEEELRDAHLAILSAFLAK